MSAIPDFPNPIQYPNYFIWLIGKYEQANVKKHLKYNIELFGDDPSDGYEETTYEILNE